MDITFAMDRDTVRDHQTALTADGTLVGVGKAVAREGLLPPSFSPFSGPDGVASSVCQSLCRTRERVAVVTRGISTSVVGCGGYEYATHARRAYILLHRWCTVSPKKKCAAPLPLLSSAPFFTERMRRGARGKFRVVFSAKVKTVRKEENI